MTASEDRAATGIAGLDDVLGGGFTRNRLYLVEGNPGAGKTTLALQFLLEGARAGRARPLRHAVGDRGRAARGGALARLVARRRSSSSSWSPPRSLLDADAAAEPAPLRPSWSSARRPGLILERVERLAARARRVRLALARCACWRRTRCATAARSWR